MRAEKSDKKEFILPSVTNMQTEKSGQNLFFESGGEYVLPDYMPKIEKLLRVETKVLPPSQYISANEAQLTGNLLYSLIYMGDEGEVSATVLSSKYDFAVPRDSDETSKIIAIPAIDSVNFRIGAPRKLNIRTKLRSQPHIFGEKDISPLVPENETGLHTLCGEIDGVETKILHTDIAVSETVEISGSENVRLIWCGANAAVTDVRASEGGVQIRGEVCVKLLSTDGSDAKMHIKKIPFEEFLDGELSRKCAACATAQVISTEASIKQGTEVLVDVVLDAVVYADIPRKLEVMFDAFSEDAEVSAEYMEVPCKKSILSRSSIYNVSGSVPLSALNGYKDTFDASGEAILEEVKAENGKIMLCGKCVMSFIYNTEGGYSSLEESVPFKMVLEAETAQNVDAIPQVALHSVRTRAEGENLVCDIELAVCVRAYENKGCKAVKSINADKAKKYEKSKTPLCLIYPKGESLWSLSKKHHISPDKLAKTNMLSIGKEEYTSVEALIDSKILMLQF